MLWNRNSSYSLPPCPSPALREEAGFLLHGRTEAFSPTSTPRRWPLLQSSSLHSLVARSPRAAHRSSRVVGAQPEVDACPRTHVIEAPPSGYHQNRTPLSTGFYWGSNSRPFSGVHPRAQSWHSFISKAEGMWWGYCGLLGNLCYK